MKVLVVTSPFGGHEIGRRIAAAAAANAGVNLAIHATADARP